MGGTIVGSETSGAITVTASAYDSMLHRDSRFWDVIAQRRNEKNQAGTSAPASDPSGEANVCSPFYGPTIGRRREFLDEAASSSKSKDDEDSGKLSVSSKKSALQSFTIGGELDFTLADEASSGSSAHETSVLTTTEDLSIEKKDDLMDALMAIDDELDEEEVDDEEIERIDQDNSIVEVPNSVMTEEIVFDSTSVASLESSNEDVIIAPLKADEASLVEVAEDEAKEILPATVEENSMNLDDLVINGTVSANIDNEGDDGGYDFSDDDDELADIEQFLMKS
jgi:hypothetical protein